MAIQSLQLALPFPIEEYQGRWERVQHTIEERGHETAVIWQRAGGSYDRAGDVHWLTNYAPMASGQEPSVPGISVGRAFAALIMRAGQEPELHIAEPVEATDLTQVAVGSVVGHGDLVAGVAARLRELNIEGRVALVGEDVLPAQFHAWLTAALPEVVWDPADDLTIAAQRLKTPRERDVYREAGAIASSALSKVMHALIDGETGSEAASRGAAEIIRGGGGFHRVCVHHGPGSERVMWSNGLYGHDTTAPQPGDMLRAWVYGPILHGFWLDPGRSAVCGNQPTPAQRRLVETTANLTTDIIAAIRPGVTPREVGLIADDLAAKTGYLEGSAAVWDLYGHGLGSYFQPPLIPSGLAPGAPAAPEHDVDRAFEEHMAFTVETFLTDDGVGTATFEQVFLIQKDGVELLTTTPMLFW